MIFLEALKAVCVLFLGIVSVTSFFVGIKVFMASDSDYKRRSKTNLGLNKKTKTWFIKEVTSDEDIWRILS